MRRIYWEKWSQSQSPFTKLQTHRRRKSRKMLPTKNKIIQKIYTTESSSRDMDIVTHSGENISDDVQKKKGGRHDKMRQGC
mmetsp:Transcript_58627/g.174523  ORF Transcript_58627/g.174523 Transcript_58627/m.174523 type:complete len:81 (+) Transcript_58627:3648-3890(+)